MMNKDEILRYADQRFIGWLMDYHAFLQAHVHTLSELLENYTALSKDEAKGWVPVPNLVSYLSSAKSAIDAVDFELLQVLREEKRTAWRKKGTPKGWVPDEKLIAQVNEAKRLVEIITNEIVQHQKQELLGQQMAEDYNVLSRSRQQHDPSTQ